MLSDELNQYLTTHSHPLTALLLSLCDKTEKELDSAHMLSGPLISTLLRLLTRITRPQFILDLGTYTGFSALSMAEAIDSTGKILTCDIDPLHLEHAKENFKKHPKGSQIEIFEGSVFECLESLKTEVDFVFLDANKNTYLEYYEALIPRIRSGGLLVIDDVLWKGRAIAPVKIREKRMDQMNKMILEDQRVENILLPIRNGVNIVYKH